MASQIIENIIFQKISVTIPLHLPIPLHSHHLWVLSYEIFDDHAWAASSVTHFLLLLLALTYSSSAIPPPEWLVIRVDHFDGFDWSCGSCRGSIWRRWRDKRMSVSMYWGMETVPKILH